MIKTSIKIDNLMKKLSNLTEDLDKDNIDFIDDLIILDVEYYDAISILKLIEDIFTKSQKNNLPIFYTKNNYNQPHYCFVFIGNEDEIIAKIQSGINKLLILKKQYDKEYKINMKHLNKSKISDLKKEIKKLERNL